MLSSSSLDYGSFVMESLSLTETIQWKWICFFGSSKHTVKWNGLNWTKLKSFFHVHKFGKYFIFHNSRFIVKFLCSDCVSKFTKGVVWFGYTSLWVYVFIVVVDVKKDYSWKLWEIILKHPNISFYLKAWTLNSISPFSTEKHNFSACVLCCSANPIKMDYKTSHWFW